MLPETWGTSTAPRVNPTQQQTWVSLILCLSSFHALFTDFVFCFSFSFIHGWQVIPPWWGIQFQGLTIWSPTKDDRDLCSRGKDRTRNLVSWLFLFEYFSILSSNSLRILWPLGRRKTPWNLDWWFFVCFCVYFWLVAAVVGLKPLSSVRLCLQFRRAFTSFVWNAFLFLEGTSKLDYGIFYIISTCL